MKLIAAILHDIAFVLIGDVLGEGRCLPLFGVVRLITTAIMFLRGLVDDSALFLFIAGILLESHFLSSVLLGLLRDVQRLIIPAS